jgi:asparagine synthase (glutamine-hydrolysing)
MCGLSGYISSARESEAQMTDVARRMAQRLVHRGPDDSGEWIAADCGVALSHRRLSILDLSAMGHQPMLSASGRFVIAFNGEIYNYRELRRELDESGAQAHWRGSSDTEVMLAAFEHWGVEKSLPRLNGMFAFALWDRTARQLCLARDRFGEKPLYYGTCNGTFLFGSELRALSAHSAWRGELNRAAFNQFMLHKYVSGPGTIYRGISKLAPASYLVVDVDPVAGHFRAGAVHQYWSAVATATLARDRQLTDLEEAKQEFSSLFRSAVSLRVRSDVPLGAFLSGGIDSSLIVAAMRQSGVNPIKTFTIGYEDTEYDESTEARAIANHLGTEHHAIPVTAREVGEAITIVPSLFDEPFADISQLPTYLVSRSTKRHVRVALTGDGGDELFGGYHRYFVGQRTWQVINRMPSLLRRWLTPVLRSITPDRWDDVITLLNRNSRLKVLLDGYSGHRLHTLANVLNARSVAEMYELLIGGPHSGLNLLCDPGGDAEYNIENQWPSGFSPTDSMMLADTIGTLPDDLLVKVDRVAMSVSLETRAPFLDPDIFEFAWRLPIQWKITGQLGKVFLRNVLTGYLPEKLIDPRKRGFGVPIERWLRGPLRDWTESLLNERDLAAGGLVNPAAVRVAWEQYLRGSLQQFSGLWNILVFQSWVRSQNSPIIPSPTQTQ